MQPVDRNSTVLWGPAGFPLKCCIASNYLSEHQRLLISEACKLGSALGKGWVLKALKMGGGVKTKREEVRTVGGAHSRGAHSRRCTQ